MPVFESVALVLILAATWFWHDTIKARDAGVAAARDECRAKGLLFLDDTVATQKLKLARDDGGRLCILRVFGFEYSDTGDNRRRGSVTTTGADVVSVYTGPVLLKDIA